MIKGTVIDFLAYQAHFRGPATMSAWETNGRWTCYCEHESLGPRGMFGYGSSYHRALMDLGRTMFALRTSTPAICWKNDGEDEFGRLAGVDE